MSTAYDKSGNETSENSLPTPKSYTYGSLRKRGCFRIFETDRPIVGITSLVTERERTDAWIESDITWPLEPNR